MGLYTLVTNFEIGEKVFIPELGIHGRVRSIWIVESGVKYQIRYFHESKDHEVYFYPDELEPERTEKENSVKGLAGLIQTAQAEDNHLDDK